MSTELNFPCFIDGKKSTIRTNMLNGSDAVGYDGLPALSYESNDFVTINTYIYKTIDAAINAIESFKKLGTQKSLKVVGCVAVIKN